MTTTELSTKEREEVFDAFIDLKDFLQEETWKMAERSDFEKIVAIAKTELEKFRENHSEEATRALAEKICEYAIFDVRWDTEWQLDAADEEFELSSSAYGLSDSEYSKATRWARCDFQLELAELNQGTTLQMLAYGTGKDPVVREAVIW